MTLRLLRTPVQLLINMGKANIRSANQRLPNKWISEQRKYSVSVSSLGEDESLLPKLRREQAACCEEGDLNHHSFQTRNAEEHLRAYDTSSSRRSQRTTNDGEQLRTETIFSMGSSKFGDCLVDLNFSCDIQMIRSAFGVNNIEAWIHLDLHQWFKLLVV